MLNASHANKIFTQLQYGMRWLLIQISPLPRNSEWDSLVKIMFLWHFMQSFGPQYKSRFGLEGTVHIRNFCKLKVQILSTNWKN